MADAVSKRVDPDVIHLLPRFGQGAPAYLGAMAVYVLKLAASGFVLAVFETAIAKMRVFRYADFLGAALMLGLLATLLLFVSQVT